MSNITYESNRNNLDNSIIELPKSPMLLKSPILPRSIKSPRSSISTIDVLPSINEITELVDGNKIKQLEYSQCTDVFNDNEIVDNSIYTPEDLEPVNNILKNIPVIMEDGIISSVYERDEAHKTHDVDKPSPRRLTFIHTLNSCQFCSNPIGPVYTHCITYYIGFVSCELCNDKATSAMKEWMKLHAYGRLRHLKDMNIKIKRSSGVIESGWKLHSPFIKIDNNNIEYIECISSYNTHEPLVTRNCYVDSILELN